MNAPEGTYTVHMLDMAGASLCDYLGPYSAEDAAKVADFLVYAFDGDPEAAGGAPEVRSASETQNPPQGREESAA